MAKLTRVPAKVFAASAAADEIGQFGSAVAGSKLETADVATIQGLSAWLDGWSEALVSGNRYPALQEMNGLLKVLSYQGAYALQEGIPEYDAATPYFIGSIVKKTGTFELYGSLTNNNVGNALTVDTEWQLLVNLADIGGGGVVDFENYGEVTTNLTLLENKISTAYFSTTSSITLPTITDTAKQVTCILDFTTATTGQPTITNINLKWSNTNGGKAPTSYATASGIQNVLIFKSIWISSVLYWEVEYGYYGGVETTFVQPTLSANGTLGGASFAVSASTEENAAQACWHAFNKDGFTTQHAFTSANDGTYIFYNPLPIKITSMDWTNRNGSQNSPKTISWYGSSDNSTYTLIANLTNTNNTGSATYNVAIPDGVNRTFYKYHKAIITDGNTEAYFLSLAEIGLNAVYIAA